MQELYSFPEMDMRHSFQTAEELANYNIGLDEVEATLRWINDITTIQVRWDGMKSPCMDKALDKRCLSLCLVKVLS